MPFRILIAAATITLLCLPAAADDLADFNAAIEDFAAHNRTAIGYLRTDAAEMAGAEMENAKTSWGAFAERFGGRRPAAFANNPLYTEALVDVPTRIVTGFLMLNLGRPDLAANSLHGIREELSALRRASRVEVLADCILDANKAVAPIATWDTTPPDLKDAKIATEAAATVDAIAAALKRCNAMAPASLRDNPTFRRLIDGPLAAAAAITKAIEAQDGDALRRMVGELRQFNELLIYRYG